MTPDDINKARGCACLSKINAQIKSEYGEESDLQLGAFTLMDPEAEQWETYTDLPPLKFKWKDKRKVRTGHFNFVFCPFCGKKRP